MFQNGMRMLSNLWYLSPQQWHRQNSQQQAHQSKNGFNHDAKSTKIYPQTDKFNRETIQPLTKAITIYQKSNQQLPRETSHSHLFKYFLNYTIFLPKQMLSNSQLHKLQGAKETLAKNHIERPLNR